MRNCLVEVTESFPTGDADGVIGARIFQRFLIRFNAREKVLELLPFPEGSDVPPAMQNFTRVHQVGHLLLVSSTVNARLGYFLLDTGAAFSAVSYDLAPPGGLAGTAVALDGLSGRINGGTRVSPVQFRFSREPVVDRDVIALDLGGVSRQEGVEISGVIGYPALSRSVLTINYRDGLIDVAGRK